ncbi:MAG TPA: hypothetical protein VKP11_08440, partial [Frankiaceae bacterium]|nr:hypothetical protein [Frankiaceae bacterium]
SGGLGTFSPGPATLNATYTPTAAEVAAGHVTLTLTTNDPEGPCPAVSDQVVVTFDPAATVDAGPDRRVCASSPQVQLAGTVGGGASGGTWSGGGGSFSPGASILNATYTPTAGEIAAGGVTLTLTTHDPAGPCPAVADQMRVTIDPATTADAGPDQTVCSSAPQVQLQGSVGGTVSSGTWSGGTGSFAPGRAALDAQYAPSAAEIAAGSVTLTLTSATPGGPCGPASDALTILIRPAATVNAGPDQVVCAAAPTVKLAASVGGGATAGTWSGGGGTFDPGRAAPDAAYTPTPAEITAGSVTLTLTTDDPEGPCPAVSDQVKLTFDAPAVTVPDRVVCAGINSVTLCADVSQGLPPYTYRWNTGERTACITVSDTARYMVTVTDARGCRAVGWGRFRWRDCRGQLAHTSTTCDSYMAGNADDFSTAGVNWVTRDDVITSISPGVFFYFSVVTAPRDSFRIVLMQARDNPAFPFCEVQQDQVVLYDADCNRAALGYSTGPGQAAVDVTGAKPGQVFVVCVKYSLKPLVGTALLPGTGVHYSFETLIDGKVVDSDPDGLQIGAQRTTAVGDL